MLFKCVPGLLAVLLLLVGFISARIHKFNIKKDSRRFISLSTFGFYKDGILDVSLINFKAVPFKESAVFGFTLDRTLSDAMNPYLDSHDKCVLQGATSTKSDYEQRDETAVIYFTFDLKETRLMVNCSSNVHSLHIYQNSSAIWLARNKRGSMKSLSDTALFPRKKRDSSPHELRQSNNTKSNGAAVESTSCSKTLPMSVHEVNNEKLYNTSFAMYVANEDQEGLYNLYFHNCPNYGPYRTEVDFSMEIKEMNDNNFLSAGEMPLPELYFMMAVLFFLSGCFWVYILKHSKHPVFKLHYLMAVLVYLKSLSLLFHGINFHFIQTKGEHVAAWAVLYYITHLLKGAVLFITIVLIGTGWTFIKHILADKDKKLFMIVIPLQVLANVAEIIIEESEEGDIEHNTWRYVFILVDLLCCGAIMFPVVWSIRHLQEAAHMDGKAAANLRKLKLFRHFYIMIVCYIYFTRVIVFLLTIAVPFQYQWLDEMFREMTNYVFFVLTGYKFRPASANPYFTLSPEELAQEDDDDETDIVLFSSVSGGSAMAEGLSKVNKVIKVNRSNISEVPSTQEERDTLISKRESLLEYD
ncbi:protein GPR107 isoform X1 [Copidosoma floridanum]|uniref:protein GPR107 isoform X1 n=1 Tax=Copidosoma floridanum TaxID=29053 RepID=UPI0006C984AB|nr:protein GPR107 isoform X1 [Copidosoma floridanum]XP_014206513.1 protein GPR107 isoform X1 [Copidosoma floridanum]